MKGIIILIFVMILLVPSVFGQSTGARAAIAGGIVAGSAASVQFSPNVNSGGCFPPIEYSIENQCDLRVYDKNSINKFKCGDYIVTGDCRGGVLDTQRYNEIKEELISAAPFISIGIAFLFVTSILRWRSIL